MSGISSNSGGIRILKSVVFLLLLFSIGSYVNAQVVIDNIVDRSLTRYETRFDFFAALASNLVLNTFYLLAVIELSWSVFSVLIRNAGLQAFLSTLVTRIMFIGFFAYLLTRGSQTAIDIKDSFIDLAVATTATTGTISPGTIMDLGQDLFARMYGQATDIGVFDLLFDENTSLSTPIILIFAGMLVFIVMAIMSAHFAVVLLEAFFAASGGVILLGLGSNRWTYKYATGYLKYAMSVGMKLFIFTIIVGLTIDEINRFITQAAIDEINNVFALLAFVTFSAIVSIIVPKSVKGMMEGISIGSADITSINDNRRMISRTTGQVNKLLIPK